MKVTIIRFAFTNFRIYAFHFTFLRQCRIDTNFWYYPFPPLQMSSMLMCLQTLNSSMCIPAACIFVVFFFCHKTRYAILQPIQVKFNNAHKKNSIFSLPIRKNKSRWLQPSHAIYCCYTFPSIIPINKFNCENNKKKENSFWNIYKLINPTRMIYKYKASVLTI